MDLQNLSRRQLQALCKKHGIPANSTNAKMLEALQDIHAAACLKSGKKARESGEAALREIKSHGKDPADKTDLRANKRYVGEQDTHSFPGALGATRRGRQYTAYSNEGHGVIDEKRIEGKDAHSPCTDHTQRGEQHTKSVDAANISASSVMKPPCSSESIRDPRIITSQNNILVPPAKIQMSSPRRSIRSRNRREKDYRVLEKNYSPQVRSKNLPGNNVSISMEIDYAIFEPDKEVGEQIIKPALGKQMRTTRNRATKAVQGEVVDSIQGEKNACTEKEKQHTNSKDAAGTSSVNTSEPLSKNLRKLRNRLAILPGKNDVDALQISYQNKSTRSGNWKEKDSGSLAKTNCLLQVESTNLPKNSVSDSVEMNYAIKCDRENKFGKRIIKPAVEKKQVRTTRSRATRGVTTMEGEKGHAEVVEPIQVERNVYASSGDMFKKIVNQKNQQRNKSKITSKENSLLKTDEKFDDFELISERLQPQVTAKLTTRKNACLRSLQINKETGKSFVRRARSKTARIAGSDDSKMQVNGDANLSSEGRHILQNLHVTGLLSNQVTEAGDHEIRDTIALSEGIVQKQKGGCLDAERASLGHKFNNPMELTETQDIEAVFQADQQTNIGQEVTFHISGSDNCANMRSLAPMQLRVQYNPHSIVTSSDNAPNSDLCFREELHSNKIGSDNVAVVTSIRQNTSQSTAMVSNVGGEDLYPSADKQGRIASVVLGKYQLLHGNPNFNWNLNSEENGACKNVPVDKDINDLTSYRAADSSQIYEENSLPYFNKCVDAEVQGSSGVETNTQGNVIGMPRWHSSSPSFKEAEAVKNSDGNAKVADVEGFDRKIQDNSASDISFVDISARNLPVTSECEATSASEIGVREENYQKSAMSNIFNTSFSEEEVLHAEEKDTTCKKELEALFPFSYIDDENFMNETAKTKQEAIERNNIGLDGKLKVNFSPAGCSPIDCMEKEDSLSLNVPKTPLLTHECQRSCSKRTEISSINTQNGTSKEKIVDEGGIDEVPDFNNEFSTCGSNSNDFSGQRRIEQNIPEDSSETENSTVAVAEVTGMHVDIKVASYVGGCRLMTLPMVIKEDLNISSLSLEDQKSAADSVTNLSRNANIEENLSISSQSLPFSLSTSEGQKSAADEVEESMCQKTEGELEDKFRTKNGSFLLQSSATLDCCKADSECDNVKTKEEEMRTSSSPSRCSLECSTADVGGDGKDPNYAKTTEEQRPKFSSPLRSPFENSLEKFATEIFEDVSSDRDDIESDEAREIEGHEIASENDITSMCRSGGKAEVCEVQERSRTGDCLFLGCSTADCKGPPYGNIDRTNPSNSLQASIRNFASENLLENGLTELYRDTEKAQCVDAQDKIRPGCLLLGYFTADGEDDEQHHAYANVEEEDMLNLPSPQKIMQKSSSLKKIATKISDIVSSAEEMASYEPKEIERCEIVSESNLPSISSDTYLNLDDGKVIVKMGCSQDSDDRHPVYANVEEEDVLNLSTPQKFMGKSSFFEKFATKISEIVSSEAETAKETAREIEGCESVSESNLASISSDAYLNLDDGKVLVKMGCSEDQEFSLVKENIWENKIDTYFASSESNGTESIHNQVGASDVGDATATTKEETELTLNGKDHLEGSKAESENIHGKTIVDIDSGDKLANSDEKCTMENIFETEDSKVSVMEAVFTEENAEESGKFHAGCEPVQTVVDGTASCMNEKAIADRKLQSNDNRMGTKDNMTPNRGLGKATSVGKVVTDDVLGFHVGEASLAEDVTVEVGVTSEDKMGAENSLFSGYSQKDLDSSPASEIAGTSIIDESFLCSFAVCSDRKRRMREFDQSKGERRGMERSTSDKSHLMEIESVHKKELLSAKENSMAILDSTLLRLGDLKTFCREKGRRTDNPEKCKALEPKEVPLAGRQTPSRRTPLRPLSSNVVQGPTPNNLLTSFDKSGATPHEMAKSEKTHL